MQYAGWIILGVAIILALCWAYSVRHMVRRGTPPTRMTVNITMLWWLGVFGVLLIPLSPLHLLWWYPVSIAVAGLSLVGFPFSILDIPGRFFANLWCAGLNRSEIERNECLQEEGQRLYRVSLKAGMSPEEAKREAVESLKAYLDNQPQTVNLPKPPPDETKQPLWPGAITIIICFLVAAAVPQEAWWGKIIFWAASFWVMVTIWYMAKILKPRLRRQ
jgi:hypothetical protein